MRTTLTIEPAIAERIRKRMAAKDLSLKQVINDALREGLRALEAEHDKKRPKFKVEPHSFKFLPGIDLNKIGQFADELEDEEIVRKMNRGKR
jgi:hypothetical protein